MKKYTPLEITILKKTIDEIRKQEENAIKNASKSNNDSGYFDINQSPPDTIGS